MTLLRLTPAMGTHVGMRRRHNEDSIGYRYPDAADVLLHSGAMFIIADGVGGLSAGERASSMAVENIIKHYYSYDTDISAEERLAKATHRINKDVYQLLNDPGKPAATTLVVIVLIGNKLIAVSVGDSQIFLVRDDEIQQLNEIDIVTDNTIENGALTRAIGYREALEVETITGTIQPDDILIMCSDGLTRYLSEDQLKRLSSLRDPRDSVRRMINEANQQGGADNVSVAVVKVGSAIEVEDVSKHVQKLVVPVSIDTQPMITPDVETKPNTNIPLSRPETVVPDYSIAVTPNPDKTLHSRPTGRYPRPEQDKNQPFIIGVAVAVLALGAIFFFGALIYITRGTDNEQQPTATIEANTENSTPTEPQATPVVDDGTIGVGDNVTVATSIPTLVRVGESVGSFVTVPDTPYLIQEIFEDTEGLLWYRLLDEESNQTGWIAARDVTAVE